MSTLTLTHKTYAGQSGIGNNLKYCYCPDGISIVTNDDYHAFTNCINLEKIWYKNSSSGRVNLSGCSKLKYAEISGIKIFNNRDFPSSYITAVNLPPSVKVLAFRNLYGGGSVNTNIKKVNFNSKIEYIPELSIERNSVTFDNFDISDVSVFGYFGGYDGKYLGKIGSYQSEITTSVWSAGGINYGNLGWYDGSTGVYNPSDNTIDVSTAIYYPPTGEIPIIRIGDIQDMYQYRFNRTIAGVPLINTTTDPNIENIDLDFTGNNKIRKIQTLTFKDCSINNLDLSFVDSSNLGDYCFNNCDFEGAVTFPNGSDLPAGSYYHSRFDSSVITIPNRITKIYTDNFSNSIYREYKGGQYYYRTNIDKSSQINLHSSIEYIGDRVFAVDNSLAMYERTGSGMDFWGEPGYYTGTYMHGYRGENWGIERYEEEKYIDLRNLTNLNHLGVKFFNNTPATLAILPTTILPNSNRFYPNSSGGNYSHLKILFFPGAISIIRSELFPNCENLEDVNVLSMESYYYGHENNNGKFPVDPHYYGFPYLNVQVIQEYAFYRNKFGSNYDLGNNIRFVGPGAMYGKSGGTYSLPSGCIYFVGSTIYHPTNNTILGVCPGSFNGTVNGGRQMTLLRPADNYIRIHTNGNYSTDNFIEFPEGQVYMIAKDVNDIQYTIDMRNGTIVNTLT